MVKKLAWISKYLFLFLVLLFVYAPILILVVYSFVDTNTIGKWGEFTWEHYLYLFESEKIMPIVWQTVLMAVIVAVLSTILGTLGAIGIFYSKRRTSALLSGVSQIPVINAEIVTALSIAVMVSAIGFLSKETYLPLICGLMTLCTPFVVLSVIPKLKQMDNNLYEAALDLGATPTQALFKVVIPQILPGIFSGFLLSITLSLDDYVITAYTKPSSFDTISTYLYSLNKGGATARIKAAFWALTAIIFLIIVIVVIVANIRAIKAKQES